MRRSEFRRAGGLALSAVLALSSVAACTDGSSSPRVDNDAVALAAAVRVEAEGCGTRASLGAGSFVDDGLVITVAHVVAGSDEVFVVLPDGERVDAMVVAIDRLKDLAVLAVDSDVDPLALGTMRPGSDGSFVVYRDDDAVVEPFEAVTFVDIDAPTIDHDDSSLRRGYQIRAVIAKGDSGAVLVVDGVATAVVFARSTATDGSAWAVDITEADPLLDEAREHKVADVGECV